MKRLAATYKQKHYYRSKHHLVTSALADNRTGKKETLSFKKLIGNLSKLLLLLIISYGLAVFINQQLIVRSIECRALPGNYPCPDSLAQQCQTLYQKRLLFYPYDQLIASWSTPDLPFTNFVYQKFITGKLNLYFLFEQAQYLIIDEQNQAYGFTQTGHFTPIPTNDSLPQIFLSHQQLIPHLAQKQLDNVLAQQFSQLASLLKLTHTQIEKITLLSAKSLEIKTAKAVYWLDLFSLDENLQKLDFIEQSDYTQTNGQTIIDLRLNLPVVKKAIDDTI